MGLDEDSQEHLQIIVESCLGMIEESGSSSRSSNLSSVSIDHYQENFQHNRTESHQAAIDDQDI